MALEVGTYISDLDVSNPASTDLLKQADDHLRLIKSCIKNTFPNITGAVTATQDDINSPPSSVPVGCVLLWYGAESSIPAGYAKCDGGTYNKSDNSGTIVTPNLVDHIPMGAGSIVAQGVTAGAASVTVDTPATSAPLSGSTDSQGDHNHGAGTLAAPVPGVTATIRTGDYSIVGQNTGPYVTAIDDGAGGAVTGSTANAGAHTHSLSSGNASVPAMPVTVPTLPPVLGLHYIMKI
jgi:hypothetical protein